MTTTIPTILRGDIGPRGWRSPANPIFSFYETQELIDGIYALPFRITLKPPDDLEKLENHNWQLVSESSFSFWNNPDDAEYDNL